MVLKIKKGANGISLFILYFLENKIRKIPNKAPVQKEITTPEIALLRPTSQPNPKTNLASPRPIQAPLDINHSKAKGRAITIPA